MKAFQCPIPQELNVATANGFMLSINQLPDINYFCTEANIPGLSLPPIEIKFPLSSVPIPGDVMRFDDFSVDFLVNEDFSNYQAIFNWMIGLGFPESTEQFKDFMKTQNSSFQHTYLKGYSEARLFPITPLNNPAKTFKFVDMFPIRLEQMELSTKYNDVVYLAAHATFTYNYFLMED